MPRSTRSFGLNDLALSQLTRSAYICSSCRHHALRQRIANQQSLRHASSSNIPFTERIRGKIWGTDNPPGLADPYGGPSFLERRQRERALQRQGQQNIVPEEEIREPVPIEQGVEEVAEVEEDSRFMVEEEPVGKEYKPADTWDELRHVGHKGHWQDLPPIPADEFSP